MHLKALIVLNTAASVYASGVLLKVFTLSKLLTSIDLPFSLIIGSDIVSLMQIRLTIRLSIMQCIEGRELPANLL